MTTLDSALPEQEELRMVATRAAVEPAASRRRRSVDQRQTRKAAVYLPRDSIPVDGNDPAPYTEDSDFVLVEGSILGQGAASGPC